MWKNFLNHLTCFSRIPLFLWEEESKVLLLLNIYFYHYIYRLRNSIEKCTFFDASFDVTVNELHQGSFSEKRFGAVEWVCELDWFHWNVWHAAVRGTRRRAICSIRCFREAIDGCRSRICCVFRHLHEFRTVAMVDFVWKALLCVRILHSPIACLEEFRGRKACRFWNKKYVTILNYKSVGYF